jgi:hypothetical protein
MSLPVSPVITHDETTQGNFADWVYRQNLDFSKDFVSNVFRLAIPANTAIIAVRLHVKTPSNGTAPTVAVADTAGTPLVYLAAGDVDPSAAAGTMANSLSAGHAGKTGFYYGSTPLMLTVTAGGTSAPTTGVICLEVVFSGGYVKPRDLINNFPTY